MQYLDVFSVLCELSAVFLTVIVKAERSLRHRRRHGEGTAARCRYEPLGWSQPWKVELGCIDLATESFVAKAGRQT